MKDVLFLYKNINMPVEVLKQVRAYQIFSLLNRMVFFYTIIVIFFRHFELTFKQIIIISAVESIVTAVFELPSGIVADVWGRKRTALVGIAGSALSCLLYVLIPSFAAFVAIEIILAVGAALTSGSLSALIFEKFEESGNKDAYNGFLSQLSSQRFVVSALVALSASFLYVFNVFLPFLASFFFHGTSAFFLLKVKDSHTVDTKKLTPAALSAFAWSNIKGFYANKPLLVYSLILAAFVLVISNVAFLSQPHLVDLGLPVMYLGIFFFVCNIAAAVGSAKSETVFRADKHSGFVLCAILLGICTIFLVFHYWPRRIISKR